LADLVFELGTLLLVVSFLVVLLDAFAGLRTVDFAAGALFAFGRADFVFTARLLTDAFGERREAGRAVDRRRPFVTELLMSVQNERFASTLESHKNLREISIGLTLNQRRKGSCGALIGPGDAKLNRSTNKRKHLKDIVGCVTLPDGMAFEIGSAAAESQRFPRTASFSIAWQNSEFAIAK
jgi:hypothetical protein